MLMAPPEALRAFPLSSRYAREGDGTGATGRPLRGALAKEVSASDRVRAQGLGSRP
jgi:hypothetical protein